MSPTATDIAASAAAESSARVEPSAVPVICAWCRATLRPGDPSRPASHGVCARCSARMLEAGDDRTPPPPFIVRTTARRR